MRKGEREPEALGAGGSEGTKASQDSAGLAQARGGSRILTIILANMLGFTGAVKMGPPESVV